MSIKSINPPYTFKGKSIKGDNRGKEIGFPTLNFVYKNQTIKNGVYAIKATIDNKTYNGVANVGPAPTFNRNQSLIEAHLFDYNENRYNTDVAIQFFGHIRDVQKFESKEGLIQKIQEDILTSKEFLGQIHV